ncbi:MAG: arginase [bacterium]|nr:arginase [bacterium]
MNRTIELLINKSEITAGTRGASLGPEAIMTAARTQGSHFFSKYPKRSIADRNDVLDNPIKYPNAKRIHALVEVFENVSKEVKTTLENDKFPLVIAADHGSAGGTIAGIKAAHPDKRLGVIWIDAHADIHTPYTTPSGNMHGMPLATALNEDNLASQINDPSEDVVTMWSQLKNTGVPGPKIKAEDIVYIAVRDTEGPENDIIDRLNIRNYKVEDVRSQGAEAIASATLDQLNECDIIYISFDVDSMEPSHTSHGTGTPVGNGLMPEEAKYLLTRFAAQEKTACIEFVEVNPCLDEKLNTMAEVAFELLEATVAELEK